MKNIFEEMKSKDKNISKNAFYYVEGFIREYFKKQGSEASYRDVVFWTRKCQTDDDYILAITENISFMDFDNWMCLQEKLKVKMSFSSAMKIIEILDEENISILD